MAPLRTKLLAAVPGGEVTPARLGRISPRTLLTLVAAVLAAIATALRLQFAAIYLPLLNDLLKTEPLHLTDLLIVSALSTLGYAAIRLDRIVHRGKPPTRRRTEPQERQDVRLAKPTTGG